MLAAAVIRLLKAGNIRGGTNAILAVKPLVTLAAAVWGPYAKALALPKAIFVVSVGKSQDVGPAGQLDASANV